MNPKTFLGTMSLGALIIGGCQAMRPASKMQPTDGRAIPAASIQRGMTLGDLTGGELGLGGGFLIAAAPEKIREKKHEEALAAAQKAEESPAQLLQVRDTANADLNKDGFVTLDEVLALARAGLNDREMIERLRNTHYVFHLTPAQERYLMDRGVPESVVADLRALSGGPAVASQ